MRKRKESKEAQPAKKRKPQLHEITRENDIRYRGPLNYQHFQMLGWFCIVLSQAVLLMRIGTRMDETFAAGSETLAEILGTISSMSLPFLLIANFAKILNNIEGYKKQLIKNGCAMLAMTGGSILVIYRYLIGGLQVISNRPETAEADLGDLFRIGTGYGFICFNIFVDLFLCSLVMFFLNYFPKKVFTGKRCVIFRSFALLPIVYEAVCIILKIRSCQGDIELPVWSYPLLTVKPPMTFVLFIILALYVKNRERRFRKYGKTHAEYVAFLKTNRNSWNFSRFLAIMLVVTGLLDMLMLMGMSIWHTARKFEAVVLIETAGEVAPETVSTGAEILLQEPAAEAATGASREEADAETAETDELTAEEFADLLIEEQMMSSYQAMEAVGFGGSVHLIFLAPLVLLFSYTRIPKYRQLSVYIPMVAIGIIVLLYLEGGLMVLQGVYERLRMDPDELMDTLK